MATPSPEKTAADTNTSPAAASNTPAPKPKPKPKTWNLKNFVEFFGVEEEEVYGISEALTRVMQSRPLPDKTLQTKAGKEEIENFLRSNLSELPASVQNVGDDVDVMEALKGLFRRILTQKFQYLRKPPAKAGESSGSGKTDKKNAAGDGKKSKKVNDGKAGAAGEKKAKEKPEAKDEVSEEDDSSDEYETETEEDEEEPKKPENAPDAKGKARASAEHVVNTSSNNTSETTEETSSESGSDSDTISRSTSEKPKSKAGNKEIIIKRGKRTLTLYTFSNHHSTNMASNNNTPETTTIKTTITNAPPVMEVNIPEPRTKRVKLSSRSDRILDLLENGTIWALNEPRPDSHGLVSIQELLAQPESTEEPKVTDLDFQAWVNSVTEQCGYDPSLHRLEYRAPEKVLPLVGGQQACIPIIAVEQWRAVLKAHAASDIATDPVFYLVERGMLLFSLMLKTMLMLTLIQSVSIR